MITKEELDSLVEQYETPDFIPNDPILFPHRYSFEEDIAIAGFVASCLAYGNRKVFIQKLNELFNAIDNEPFNYVMNFNPRVLINFNYRFAKDFDLIMLFKMLHRLYCDEKKTLKQLFQQNYKDEIIPMLQAVCDYFYTGATLTPGYCHLVPNPKKGSTLKRLNLFLRWMVRKPPVDFGIWDFIPTDKLVMPFDVHVANMAREMGLLNRNSDDFKSVLELTEVLKRFDAEDPTKYDFALFGYGISHSKVLETAD